MNLIKLRQNVGGSTGPGKACGVSKGKIYDVRKQPIFHLAQVLPSNVVLTSDKTLLDEKPDSCYDRLANLLKYTQYNYLAYFLTY